MPSSNTDHIDANMADFLGNGSANVRKKPVRLRQYDHLLMLNFLLLDECRMVRSF